MNRRFIKRTPVTLIEAYTPNVPFHVGVFVTEHTLTTNDELTPVVEIGTPETFRPVPGYGAFYRLKGDGIASPTFNALFKKSSASGNYDNTLDTLNLITFVFDGVDYWYSIVQAV